MSASEGKGFYTVPVQYKPSGRAEDQEAGPVARGAGGARPVRTATPAAAPGKHFVCYVWYSQKMYDIVCNVVRKNGKNL